MNGEARRKETTNPPRAKSEDPGMLITAVAPDIYHMSLSDEKIARLEKTVQEHRNHFTNSQGSAKEKEDTLNATITSLRAQNTNSSASQSQSIHRHRHLP